MNKRSLQIFDIDGTILCSKHRQLTDQHGQLDLAHWREHCTPEKIALDKELPCADVMRGAWQAGALVAICTSRVMQTADYLRLHAAGLKYHYIASRHPTDTRSDGPFKLEKLEHILVCFGVPAHRAKLYDDNESVLAVSRSLGIVTIDAKILNAHLMRKQA